MAHHRRRKPRILIVDDQSDIRAVIRLHLQSEFTIFEAENGPTALEKIIREKPEIILLDLAMPGMSGLEVLRYIKSRRSLPVIVITAYGTKRHVMESWQGGADDFIEKPIDFPVLKSRLLKLISEKDQSASLSKSRAQIRQPDLHPAVAGALDLIHNRYRQSLTLEAIANSCHLHPNYLWRLFKTQVGVSIHTYLTNHRLSLAPALLKKTGRVDQTAAQLGFSDAKYFSKVFSKTYGITPSRYLRT